MQVSHETRTHSSELSLNLKEMPLFKYNPSMEKHSNFQSICRGTEITYHGAVLTWTTLPHTSINSLHSTKPIHYLSLGECVQVYVCGCVLVRSGLNGYLYSEVVITLIAIVPLIHPAITICKQYLLSGCKTYALLYYFWNANKPLFKWEYNEWPYLICVHVLELNWLVSGIDDASCMKALLISCYWSMWSCIFNSLLLICGYGHSAPV